MFSNESDGLHYIIDNVDDDKVELKHIYTCTFHIKYNFWFKNSHC